MYSLKEKKKKYSSSSSSSYDDESCEAKKGIPNGMDSQKNWKENVGVSIENPHVVVKLDPSGKYLGCIGGDGSKVSHVVLIASNGFDNKTFRGGKNNAVKVEGGLGTWMDKEWHKHQKNNKAKLYEGDENEEDDSYDKLVETDNQETVTNDTIPDLDPETDIAVVDNAENNNVPTVMAKHIAASCGRTDRVYIERGYEDYSSGDSDTEYDLHFGFDEYGKPRIEHMVACNFCGNDLSGKERSVCSACNMGTYCDSKCATKHWTEGDHSTVCERLKIESDMMRNNTVKDLSKKNPTYSPNDVNARFLNKKTLRYDYVDCDLDTPDSIRVNEYINPALDAKSLKTIDSFIESKFIGTLFRRKKSNTSSSSTTKKPSRLKRVMAKGKKVVRIMGQKGKQAVMKGKQKGKMMWTKGKEKSRGLVEKGKEEFRVKKARVMTNLRQKKQSLKNRLRIPPQSQETKALKQQLALRKKMDLSDYQAQKLSLQSQKLKEKRKIESQKQEKLREQIEAAKRLEEAQSNSTGDVENEDMRGMTEDQSGTEKIMAHMNLTHMMDVGARGVGMRRPGMSGMRGPGRMGGMRTIYTGGRGRAGISPMRMGKWGPRPLIRRKSRLYMPKRIVYPTTLKWNWKRDYLGRIGTRPLNVWNGYYDRYYGGGRYLPIPYLPLKYLTARTPPPLPVYDLRLFDNEIWLGRVIEKLETTHRDFYNMGYRIVPDAERGLVWAYSAP
jgi:hypothetical protein